ncbi:hypothetical protein BY996DRAFT_6623870 [Phakopsora pachyrhizi]|nr:hypothetical protein BY996DRAFT_6623870 [Phakopsora pachyrhizi]
MVTPQEIRQEAGTWSVSNWSAINDSKAREGASAEMTNCGLKETRQRDTQQICNRQTVLAIELDRC